MTFKKILLLTAFLAIAFVGVAYLASADAMYGRYGIEILSVNEYNMVRGAYGGLFLCFAVLFLIGAVDDRLEFSSLVALFTFMFGFAIGRVVSILLDGMPSPLVLSLLTFEVFYSLVSFHFIRKHMQGAESG